MDILAVGVGRMQRSFEPMRRQVEAWCTRQLSGGVSGKEGATAANSPSCRPKSASKSAEMFLYQHEDQLILQPVILPHACQHLWRISPVSLLAQLL